MHDYRNAHTHSVWWDRTHNHKHSSLRWRWSLGGSWWWARLTSHTLLLFSHSHSYRHRMCHTNISYLHTLLSTDIHHTSTQVGPCIGMIWWSYHRYGWYLDMISSDIPHRWATSHYSTSKTLPHTACTWDNLYIHHRWICCRLSIGKLHLFGFDYWDSWAGTSLGRAIGNSLPHIHILHRFLSRSDPHIPTCIPSADHPTKNPLGNWSERMGRRFLGGSHRCRHTLPWFVISGVRMMGSIFPRHHELHHPYRHITHPPTVQKGGIFFCTCCPPRLPPPGTHIFHSPCQSCTNNHMSTWSCCTNYTQDIIHMLHQSPSAHIHNYHLPLPHFHHIPPHIFRSFGRICSRARIHIVVWLCCRVQM